MGRRECIGAMKQKKKEREMRDHMYVCITVPVCVKGFVAATRFEKGVSGHDCGSYRFVQKSQIRDKC